MRLEEEADLQLPFLLPEDGYSCDIVRGVPSGLAEFLGPLQLAALCSMNPQPTSSGYWTIYMHEQDSRPPPGVSWLLLYFTRSQSPHFTHIKQLYFVRLATVLYISFISTPTFLPSSRQPRSPSVMSNRSVSLPRGEPEIHVIQLHKSNSGMGLSIVATKVSQCFCSFALSAWMTKSFFFYDVLSCQIYFLLRVCDVNRLGGVRMVLCVKMVWLVREYIQ